MSRLLDAVRIKIARLRYLAASVNLDRVDWVDLSKLDRRTARPDDLVVVLDGSVRSSRRLARRLASALAKGDEDMACGPAFRSGIPARVTAAGYELYHDGERPFLIPLLEGRPLLRSWASQTSVAGRPSGRVMAVRFRRLEDLTDEELDRDRVIRELRRHGPWLVVWSAAQQTAEDESQVADDLATVTQRRDQGAGEVVEYLPPSLETPGNPAPPPAAVWVGPTPTKAEPGVDTTRLEPRVAIRHAAPDWSVAPRWGDHHFAVAFASVFEERKIGTRVVPRHAWSHPFAARELVISLRGLVPAKPVVGRTNVLWVISHPEELEPSEVDGYDLVAVASTVDVPRVASMTDVPVVPLLQATSQRMSREPAESDGSIVFVGNSRGVKRPAVTWAVEQGLRPHVFGTGWEGMLSGGAVAHDPIDPQRAADLYNRAGVVLADHWDDMRRFGYVSNRVFDVAAAGGVIVTDRVKDIEELLPGVSVYDSAEDLGEIVGWILERDHSSRLADSKQIQRHVLARHTFNSRVDEMLTALGTHVEGGRDLVESLFDTNRKS